MLAFLWGAAWGAGAFICLRAACSRILRGGQKGAFLFMAANLAFIGGCVALCALFFPAGLAWTGTGLAAALLLGGMLEAMGRRAASRKKEDVHD